MRNKVSVAVVVVIVYFRGQYFHKSAPRAGGRSAANGVVQHALHRAQPGSIHGRADRVHTDTAAYDSSSLVKGGPSGCKTT